ncbi:amidohydrolase family protein [Neomoorella thermoacetica]|uniref:amidohydrolase family protein n=1 Tax=Neomoorella thermoacetica TaxID=1525 RepID=UPI0030D11C6F
MKPQEKKKCTLLIKNCTVMLPDCSFMAGASIAINGDRIIELDVTDKVEAAFFAEEVINAEGKLAIPGMVDCHTHTVQQFLRGSVVDEPPIVWIRILVPYEARLNAEDRYHAARLACLQMLKAGITTFADSGTGDMVPVIQAVQEMGLRAAITRMTRDEGDFIPSVFKSQAEVAVKKNEELYKQFHGSSNGRISIWFSVTSPMTTSPKLARLVAEAAAEYHTGIHIHLAEHLDEVKHCLTRYGMRPPMYLDSCGLLGPNVIAAHCVQISDFDIRLLAERKVNVIHCPCANLGNQGFPKLMAERAAGINIGLGNDGAHTANLDLFFQIQLLKYASQAAYGIPVFEPVVLPVTEAFKMATINGAKALMLGEQIGSLEVGKKADVVLVDVNQPHISPNRNLLNTLVMVGSGRDVTDVIIDGQVIMKNREFVSIDEEEVIKSATAQLNDFWNR